MSINKETFLKAYKKLGWNIIPVNINSKQPIGKKWNERFWEEERVRNILLSQPNINLGIMLGKIVDVEADTEASNKFLNQIIGNYPHPIYRSTKSYHHLFISPDENLTRFVVDNIEFRGHKHHSLLPPSIISGIKYEWIKPIFPVPQMPDSLRKFYWKAINTKHAKRNR